MDLSRLVSPDEPWVGLAIKRSYGWAPAGVQATLFGQLRGVKVSVTCAMTARGALALRFKEGGVKGVDFVMWFEEASGPKLPAPAPGVTDTVSLHKTVIVRGALAKFGAEPLFLPPYSPELNPVAVVCGTVKNRSRRSMLAPTRPQRTRSTQDAVGQASTGGSQKAVP
ncbi:MAG: transposase [Deltaproteobacteria bacterium]|nr:transposase [Deltaproteobacteria bacterium]